MIRKHPIYCKLFQENRHGEIIFRDCMTGLNIELESCPCCGCTGSLRIHASYGRSLIDLVDGQPKKISLSVSRLICTECHHPSTHSVLPDPIIPYCRHSLFFILRVLAEHAFHLRSVEKICEAYRISVKTFYRWQGTFWEHQKEWQGFYAAAMRDLKSFLLDLGRKTPFCEFAAAFFQKSGFSLLQSHKNPLIRSRKKPDIGNQPTQKSP